MILLSSKPIRSIAVLCRKLRSAIVKRKIRDNGVIVWMGPSPVTGDPIVAILTGLTRKCGNGKTGDMLQLWILPLRQTPYESSISKGASPVCGGCALRKICYVNLAKAPRSIWIKLQEGGYPVWRGDLADLVRGRKIRFGAYGDPAFLPLEIVAELARASDGWTGYTHQWDLLITDERFRFYLCASVETEADYFRARAKGWRPFRVRGEGDPLLPGEFGCPAAIEEGKRLKCENCLACKGAREEFGPSVQASASLIVHGERSGGFKEAIEAEAA